MTHVNIVLCQTRFKVTDKGLPDRNLGFWRNQGLLNVCWIAFAAAALPETVYFSRGSVAMARLLAVIQRRPAASSIQNARGERPASVQGELRLQGVTFAYPTRPALPVLKWRAAQFMPAGCDGMWARH